MGYGNNTVDWGGPDPTLTRINTGLHMDLAEAEDVIEKQNQKIFEMQQYIERLEHQVSEYRELALEAQSQREAWRDTAEDIYQAYAKEHIPCYKLSQRYYKHLEVESIARPHIANELRIRKDKPSKKELDEIRKRYVGHHPIYPFFTPKEIEKKEIEHRREEALKEECKRTGKPLSGHLYTDEEEGTQTYYKFGVKIRKPIR